MEQNKSNLLIFKRRLTREQMKNINGGKTINPLCVGIVECKKDAQVGDKCFEGCKCNSSLMCVDA
ncbi:MAG TPA: hypothetical protein PKN63_10520 [Chitinophagales bacterium]|nr:hypothetical protein [Chitinophagales bacterium]